MSFPDYAQPREPDPSPRSPLIGFDDYAKERELLATLQQNSADNYEKTLLTLSSAFLVFSISFLGLLQTKADSVHGAVTLKSIGLLPWSSICFASSQFVTLSSFLTSTFGLQVQIRDAEAAAQGQASYRARKWGYAVFVLFFVEGIAFIAGVALIIAFCWLNLNNLEIAIRRL